MPIKDMRNAAKLSDMCNKSDEPIYVTKNGYADMVVLSAKAYDAKIARLEAYEKVFAGVREAEAGKTSEAAAFMKNLGEIYGK